MNRRTFLATGGAVLLSFALADRGHAAGPAPSPQPAKPQPSIPMPNEPATPPPPTVTVEAHGPVLLIGLNRPDKQNLIDPATYAALGAAYHRLEHSEALRVGVLFGHGADFSRGLDAPAWVPVLTSGHAPVDPPGTINPLRTTGPQLLKPLVAAVHGATLLMGHELMLAADVRVAAADATFNQGEATRALFAAGGATVRLVREAGWGNALRLLLTGDTWNAEEARRLGLVQEITATPAAALERAVALAGKIAESAPLGVRATLESAHRGLAAGEEAAYAALLPEFVRLMGTADFQERVRALRENRAPVYLGR